MRVKRDLKPHNRTNALNHYEINSDIKSSLSNACGSGKKIQIKTRAIHRRNDPSSIQQEIIKCMKELTKTSKESIL